MFIDTHCHLDFSALSSGLSVLMRDLYESGISFVVVPATERENWSRVTALSQAESGVFYALGLHPFFIEKHSKSDVVLLEQKLFEVVGANKRKLVALGEIGLDFTRPFKDKQLEIFELQLRLANMFDLPVILHVRKAHSELITLLKKYKISRGVVHAFSGSSQLMNQYVDLGLKIGVGPVITWPSANKTRQAIAMAPLNAIVLETDSPDMAINGKHKGEGSPLDIHDIFRALAALREESQNTLEIGIWKNSQHLFGVKFEQKVKSAGNLI